MSENRQLAAIMFTDIVGYTAMMEESEQNTIILIGKHRQVLERCTAEQGGRVIQYYGDGSLSIYPSAGQAIRCALKIQELTSADPIVPLRIGIHVGEILELDGDIYGNGVNLAARVQAQGVAGSILISHPTYEVIRNQSEFRTVSLGYFDLKNVADPLLIYAIANDNLPVPKVHSRFDQEEVAQGITTPTNLPRPLTSFIGREQEQEQLRRLIQSHRLCTVTGTGGIGKTRLAIELGHALLSQFPDGVYFIDLVPVLSGSSDMIADTCLEALQVKAELGQPPRQILAENLEERRTLLILDNCEHLIEDCSLLIEYLLEHTTSPHFLATSRERLNIRGEQVWPLATLSLPSLIAGNVGAKVQDFESVQLFMDRARMVAPGFRPDTTEWQSLSEICSYLDGIPLAIELAAARIRAFSPKILLERLKNTTSFLRSRERNIASRQQTIEGLIDWSFQLLAPKEQLIFISLSVFPDSFDLHGAEQVCASPEIPEGEIIDLIDLLVDKSLILPMAGNRYRLLEVVKQFGRKKLNEANKWEEMVERFYQYLLNLSAQAYKEQLKASDKWLNILQLEYENLINALEWVSGQPDKQLNLASYLGWYWIVHFHKYKSGAKYLKMGIDNYQNRDLIRGRALTTFGRLSYFQKEPDAVQWLLESVEILQQMPPSLELATAHLHLGEFYTSFDDYQKGDEALQKCAQIASDLGDIEFLVRSSTWVCYGYIAQYLADKAEPILARNLKLAIQYNMKWDILINNHLYADCALIQERFNTAFNRYSKAFAAALDVGDHYQLAYELQGLAMSLAGLGEHEPAIIFQGVAWQRFEDLGLSPHPAMWWDRLIEKHLGKARKALGENKATMADSKGRSIPFERIVERIRNGVTSFENEN